MLTAALTISKVLSTASNVINSAHCQHIAVWSKHWC
jgi:hypothetical protein